MVNYQPYFNLSDIHTALTAKRLIISRKATNDYRNLGFEDVDAVIEILLLLTAEDYYKSYDYPNSQCGRADAYLLNVKVMPIISRYGVMPSRRTLGTAFDDKPCTEKLLSSL